MGRRGDGEMGRCQMSLYLRVRSKVVACLSSDFSVLCSFDLMVRPMIVVC
jgi:hypothetical protein